jgi:hypothetical protein
VNGKGGADDLVCAGPVADGKTVRPTERYGSHGSHFVQSHTDPSLPFPVIARGPVETIRISGGIPWKTFDSLMITV